jgi:hypothetical protein
VERAAEGWGGGDVAGPGAALLCAALLWAAGVLEAEGCLALDRRYYTGKNKLFRAGS